MFMVTVQLLCWFVLWFHIMLWRHSIIVWIVISHKLWNVQSYTMRNTAPKPIYQHYNDFIMGAIASQITSLTIVYSTVYSDVDQGKHQRSASLAFVRGIHRGPVNSPHKGPVTRKMFPFDDVIMKMLRRGMYDTMSTPPPLSYPPIVWSIGCISGCGVWHILCFSYRQVYVVSAQQWPLLLTWFNFNPSMDK